MKQNRYDILSTEKSAIPKTTTASAGLLLGIALAAAFIMVLLLSPAASALAQENVPAIYLTPTYQEIPPYGSVSIMMDTKSTQVVFARVVLLFNPSELQIVGPVEITSQMSSYVGTITVEQANRTGRLVIVLLSPESRVPVNGIIELAKIPIAPSARAGNSEINLDDDDIQIVSSDSIELPITTEGAIVNVTSLNYYFPYVYNTVPSYEINDSFEQAFGPLVPNYPYQSTVGRGDEDDYYYFYANTSAPIKITIVDAGTNKTNPDEEIDFPSITFYDDAMNIINTFSFNEDYMFLPLAGGKYYIRINYCCHFNPEKREYQFKIDFDGTQIALTNAGYITSKGNPVPNVRFNYIDLDTYNSYQSITDSSGKYYVPKEHGQCYQLSYGETSPPLIVLDQDYIRLAHENFCTNSPTDFDISPIYLLEPSSSTEPVELPVTFKWIVRATKPNESYVIHLSHRNTNNKQIRKTYNVGHVGEYTLEELFDGEGLYRWYVSVSTNESGGNWQSFIHEVYLTEDAEGQILVTLKADLEMKKSVPR